MEIKELKALEKAVLNTNLTGLFFFGMCFSTVFLTRESSLQIVLPVVAGLSFVSIYNFVRQTIFFGKYPKYIKRRRYILETFSFISMVVFAIVISLVSVLCEFLPNEIVYILVIKIYYSVGAFVIMCFLLGTAQRIGSIWGMEKKNFEIGNDANFSAVNVLALPIDQSHRLKIAKSGIFTTLFALVENFVVQIVGLGNILYYLLGLPVLLLFLFFAGRTVVLNTIYKNMNVSKILPFMIILISYAVMIVLAHVFTKSVLTVNEETFLLAYDLNTIVVLVSLALSVFPLVFFGKTSYAICKAQKLKIKSLS